MAGLPADSPLASITTSGSQKLVAVDLSKMNALKQEQNAGTLSALEFTHRG